MGGMGLLAAQHATQKLLDFAEITLLAMLGTAGALDEDLAIGDVAIATEINEFQANSRAETADDHYEFRYSGRHWPMEYRIRQSVGNFEFAGRQAFETWQATAARYYNDMQISNKSVICTPPPTLHLGNIASGNVVVASKVFAAEVKKVDRKFIAIDMEAAGFAYAASERIHPVCHVVIRGISDLGDENKKKLDKASKNAWRRYSVRNATTLLLGLLSWDGFLDATGLTQRSRDTTIQDSIRSLVHELQGCVGGPWVVGVAFGIYSHGPAVAASGNALPIDVTRLRMSDPRFRTMMEDVQPLRDQLGRVAIEEVAERVAELVTHYQEQLASTAARALIEDFDAVVMEIIFPEGTDDEAGPILLKADKIDEDAGPLAVVAFLKDPSPLVRERYVDALVAIGDTPTVVALTESVGVSQLTRLELEHGMFACALVGRKNVVKKLLSRHIEEFADAAAALFRQEIVRKFPWLKSVRK